MRMKNPWVGYLDRGYSQIKQAVVNRFRTLLPEVTDFSESNIFMIILDYVASLVELLNYYIDNMARESYIYTAQHISSLVQQSRLIDYRMKPRVAATVELLFELRDLEGNLNSQDMDILIKKGTVVSGKNNISFVTTKDKTLSAGAVRVIVNAEQIERKTDIYIGLVPGENDPILMLPVDYNHGSGTLIIGGEVWDLVDTLAFSHPLDRHFIVDYWDGGVFYIKFGDGNHGLKPKVGETVTLNYQSTYGEIGNLEAQAIKTISNLQQEGMDSKHQFTVYNPNPATGGSNKESLETLREHIGCSIRSLDRAVTYEDFRDIAKLCPGVDKVGLDFKCEFGVIYYITPDGGGLATQELLNRLIDFVNPRKVMGVPVNAKPAGESGIKLSLKVWGKYGKKYEDIREDIIEALVEEYSYNNSDINMAVNTSDIIALVDNLGTVDHLDLVHLSLIPFARQQLNTTIPFPGSIELMYDQFLPAYMEWSLLVADVKDPGESGYPTGAVQFHIAKNSENGDHQDIVLTTPFYPIDGVNSYMVEIVYEYLKLNVDISQKLKIGYAWSFSTYEINTNIPVDDNSVPILSKDNINLEIIEQSYDSWKE